MRKIHITLWAVLFGFLSQLAFGQIPANDNFANAQSIAGASGSASGTNVNATLESGEPTTTAGYVGGKSVWFRWVAPATGKYTFSLTANFDSQLAIYAGSINSLTSYGESDPGGLGGETVVLTAYSGYTYQIRVTGYSSASGTFTLNWLTTPKNDNLADSQAINLHSGPVSLNATNLGATVESGEVSYPGIPAPGKSVWYQLFITADTNITVSTAGSSFDTTLSIFRRNLPGIAGLVSIAGNDNSPSLVTSQVSFPATVAEGTYFIAVSGNSGAQGSITLSVTPSVAQPDPIAGAGYERLVSFPDLRVPGLPNRGAAPEARLTPASNGFLYGTTTEGGENGFGTVFKMTVAGELTTLVEFSGDGGNRKGSGPAASLLEASDGNLYGTTSGGGANGFGTIFRMTPSGSFTTLFEFTGNSGNVKGAEPATALVQAVDGTFYGTTSIGGQYGRGTVFRILHDGTFQTLVQFSGGGSGPVRGSTPTGLIAADGGGVYGTFYERDPSFGSGGAGGAIFRILATGVYSEVYSFETSGGGPSPLGLTRGPDGAFYGVTERSIARDVLETDYPPTVFKYTPGQPVQTLKTFSFQTGVERGLHFDEAGNLFGFTIRDYYTGSSDTMYRITPGGSFSTVVDFTAASQEVRPRGGLARGVDGNLFGMTRTGGFQNAGTVFQLSPTNEIATLLEFSNRGYIDKGQGVLAGLVEHPDGFLYGTAGNGGTNDHGVVFKLAKDGTLSKLVDFSGTEGLAPGRRPAAELLVASDGVLYGTTGYGGPLSSGTLFKVNTQGSFVSMRAFSDIPDSPVIEASDGLLYGVSGYNGLLFRIAKSGLAFEGLGSLPSPVGALKQDSQNDLYGCCRDGGANGSGYIYRRTAAGILQTVAEFGLISNGMAGIHPTAGLIQASDGKFYGTANEGGLFGFGTVYRVTAGGVVETVVSFMGPDGPRRGGNPAAGLKSGADGWYYGTTSTGGIGNQGTLYRIKTSGEFQTLLDFAYYLVDGAPVGELLFGSDGNVYGARSDALFRLVMPGPPIIYSFSANSTLDGVSELQGKVNPRGFSSTVTVEYGVDGVTFPSSVTLRTGLSGVKTTLVATSLESLGAGVKYYYRIRATNANGVTLGPVNSFATVGAPSARLTGLGEVTSNGAQINGMVDARFSDTSVVFEYGTDGSTFPFTESAKPATVSGSGELPGEVPVSAQISGLTKGLTYYYRIVATNAGGTVVSGVKSFTALIEPLAQLGLAEALSTTRALGTGTVDARGSNAAVAFEWGVDGDEGTGESDGDYPHSASSVPGTVSGSGPTNVEAVMTGLVQGKTYHYRIRANGDGGVGLSTKGSISLGILSGLKQELPFTIPPASGTVTVNFTPPTRGAWRFTGETAWRTSGVVAANLTSGKRLVEFLPVAGYISPPDEILDVAAKKQITLSRVYYQTSATETGSLTVYLEPASLGAKWRLVGTSTWRNSGGNPLLGLAVGTHLIECKPVAGQVTPPTSAITITKNQSSVVTLTYYKANNTGAAVPLPLSFDKVSADEDSPFAYVGQIRTEVGSSTGFVVKRRVVATAGHVVFDDGSLSFITGMQWLFQRHSGEYEPTPQMPRGNYLAAGYADQRIDDIENQGGSAGQGSAESQKLDYAALYFLEEAGRGGYGGYLASDSGAENEFLKSLTAQKILAGYAVDGIPPADEGKLHATEPFAGALTPSAGGVTWTTTAVRGFGGCSGGPLFVQRPNGLYLPAAIYLGGNGQTVVRSIDSSVVELFERAEVSGNGGDNNTGGGITHSSFTSFGATTQPGALVVTIQPEAARTAGAGWRLMPETSYRSSGSQKSGLSAGTYQLQLSTVSGFQVPTRQTITVTGGQLQQVTFTYAGAPLIEIEQPKGTILKDGTASISLGSVLVNSSATTTFLIRNPGRSSLKNIKVTLDGKNSDQFKISKPAKNTLAPGKNETFDVTFNPASKGKFSAAIHIFSNDANASPFDIKLTGTGVAKTSASPSLSGVARLPSWTDLYANGVHKGYQHQESKVTTSVVTLSDGRKYRALTVETDPVGDDPTVEVSSNLVDWYSGNKHTTVLMRDMFLLKVRDNTPFTAERKRFIRVSPQ